MEINAFPYEYIGLIRLSFNADDRCIFVADVFFLYKVHCNSYIYQTEEWVRTFNSERNTWTILSFSHFSFANLERHGSICKFCEITLKWHFKWDPLLEQSFRHTKLIIRGNNVALASEDFADSIRFLFCMRIASGTFRFLHFYRQFNCCRVCCTNLIGYFHCNVTFLFFSLTRAQLTLYKLKP